MRSCPNCGSPPATALSWGCGTKWKGTVCKISSLCKVRSLTHELQEKDNLLKAYEEAMAETEEEKELVYEVRKWIKSENIRGPSDIDQREIEGDALTDLAHIVCNSLGYNTDGQI